MLKYADIMHYFGKELLLRYDSYLKNSKAAAAKGSPYERRGISIASLINTRQPLLAFYDEGDNGESFITLRIANQKKSLIANLYSFNHSAIYIRKPEKGGLKEALSIYNHFLPTGSQLTLGHGNSLMIEDYHVDVKFGNVSSILINTSGEIIFASNVSNVEDNSNDKWLEIKEKALKSIRTPLLLMSQTKLKMSLNRLLMLRSDVQRDYNQTLHQIAIQGAELNDVLKVAICEDVIKPNTTGGNIDKETLINKIAAALDSARVSIMAIVNK